MTNAPSPYQAELFTAVSERADVDLNVRFMSGSSPAGAAASSQFQQCVMYGLGWRGLRDEARLFPRALWEAAIGDFDCFILSGFYTSVTFQLCEAILSLRGKPFATWLERPRPLAPDTHWMWKRLRQFMQRRTLAAADRVWCIGSLAKQEYSNVLGTDADMLVLPYCCNSQRYQDVSLDEVQAVRERFQLGQTFVFLFSGQLIARKGVDVLLEAFSHVAGRRESASLLILGDGPQRKELEASVPAALRSRIHFAGKVEQEFLPAHFRAADVFVFPSRHDGWGVVINEACAAELPIIATHQTGAAHDLVQHGQNGYLIDCDDVTALAGAMIDLIDDPVKATRFGNVSATLSESCSTGNGASRFMNHVHSTIASKN